MGSLSNFAELELLDHVFNAAYTPATTMYLALFESDPTDAGTGTESTYTSYARTAITFSAASARRVTQSAVVTFPQSTGGSSLVTHWGIYDASAAGNLLAHGALSENKTVVNANTPSVASGQAYVEITGEISDYLANKLLDLMFRNIAYPAPATHVALVTVAASNSDTGTTITEPSGGAYARKQVNVNGGAAPTWDVAAAGLVDNTHDVTMPTATASWGTAVGVCLVDAASTGNLLFYDNDMTDQVIGTDDIFKFLAGDLDITLS